MTNDYFRSGFVALIGKPNAGKSTLLNKIINKKIAITSNKPQTTRNKILGVLNREHSQIIFLDTPGMHKPKHKFGEYMLAVAENTFKEVDLILYVVDASIRSDKGGEEIVGKLNQVSTPSFLVINKTDLVSKPSLIKLIDQLRRVHVFAEIVPVSALQGFNIERLVTLIENFLPEGPRYYPPEMFTDCTDQFLIAELVREKALFYTREEVPHSLAVKVDDIRERSGKGIWISITIFVERESQKGILIGREGSMLKKIGTHARKDIESMLGNKVFLDLHVRVMKNWRKHQNYLAHLGYQQS